MVHENHGLGIYQGIEKIEVDRIEKDYMKISYAGGGNLYIPATQIGSDPEVRFRGCKEAQAEPAGRPGLGRGRRRGYEEPYRRLPRISVELYAARQDRRTAMPTSRILSGKRSLRRCFPLRRRKISWRAIEATKKDMESHEDHGSSDLRRCGIWKD